MIEISAENVWKVAQQPNFWNQLSNEITLTFQQMGARTSVAAPRQILQTPNGNGLGVMAAITAKKFDSIAMGAKIVSLTRRPSLEGVSHPGVVILIDPSSGALKACLDADAVTAIRTAAATCAITRHIRPDANRFTFIGTGTEARSHLLAFAANHPDAKMTLWGRRLEAAAEIATESAFQKIDISVESDLIKAIGNADVITSVTSAHSPFLDARWTGENAHINAIGASLPGLAEWYPDSFRDLGPIICDDPEECSLQSKEIPKDILKNANSVYFLLKDQSVMSAEYAGCRTVYKSVGLGALDIAAAALIVEHA